MQALTAIGLWLAVTEYVGIQDTLRLRVVDASVDLGLAYPVLIFLVLAGATNGVNLTDGLDGLAAGCCAIVFLTFTAMTFITGSGVQERPGAAVAPAWSAPASASSGSTRSRRRSSWATPARSASAAPSPALAVLTQTEVLLILIGGIFVIEALSVADPGDRLPALPQARLPDGADPPPLRADGLVGDEDHPALLDRGGDLLGDRLHALPAVDHP